MTLLIQIQKTLEELTKRVVNLKLSRSIPSTKDKKVDRKKASIRPDNSWYEVTRKNRTDKQDLGRGRPQSQGNGKLNLTSCCLLPGGKGIKA